MKVRPLIEFQIQRLSQSLYTMDEAKRMVLWLMEHFYNYSQTDLAIGKPLEGELKELINGVEELLKGKPIQYVTGISHFYGRDFFVDKRVLIPRRETEELVHWVLTDHNVGPLKFLDIGTGSGCIPVTIKLEHPQSIVVAVDVSPHALEVAKRNADALHARVAYYQADLFNWPSGMPEDFSVMVSNPPYVCESEKALMEKNVLDFEPWEALFVNDADPLIFYEALGHLGLKALVPKGHLYVEINENLGSETLALLEEIGYQELTIKKDMQGKDRMIRARVP